MIEYQSKTQEDLPGTKPTIAVVGIGGAGANVLDRIALEGLADAELISMNSDVRALANSVAPKKIQLGKELTQGLGAGGDPDLGREAAEASMGEIRDALRGKDLVFLCSGQGGGIGSGAAPLVAKAAKEQGAFVVVFATMPFCFEGKRRLAQARQSLSKYGGMADALITFDNDRMGELILPKEGIQQAFAAADQIISQSIRAVTSLVTQPGLIHIGMDDLISALRNNDSRCLFGHGAAKGQNRAQEALKRALKSPLLEKGKLLEKSKNLLVHISGGESMTLYEVELLMNALEKHVPETTQILFGASSDKALGDSLSVTLISSLASVEMSGEEVSHDVSSQGQSQTQQTGQAAVAEQPAQAAAAAVTAGSAVNLTSGDSMIASSPVVQQPVVQQPAQRPLAEVSAQVAQQAEPPLTPPPPLPQSQPVGYVQQGGQPSQASGLGKPSEPVQAASAAVELAPESTPEVATVEAEVKPAEAPVSEAATSVEETELEPQSVSIGAVPAPDELPAFEAVGESENSTDALAGADEQSKEEDSASESQSSAVVEVKIPAEEGVEAETEEEVEAETEEEVEAETEEEVEAETEEEVEAETEEEVEAETEEEVEAETEEEVEAETEEEVEAETEEEVEAETEEEVEAETEEEVEAETEEDVEAETEEDVEAETEEEVEAETEEDVEAETEEEVEAETEEEVEAETEDDVEAETDEEVEAETEEEVKAESEEKSEKPVDSGAPVLVKAKGASPKPIILKPVVRQDLAPAAKLDQPDEEDEAQDRPKPAVDMASALAEAEKEQEVEFQPAARETEPEPMGTMGPAAALGLEPLSDEGGSSRDSVRGATVTAKDPRTGKQQMLELEPVAKGRFDKAEPTVVDGEDLDIPTFLRKKGNYT